MKSKYCFIRCQGKLQPDTVIYHVWVGSSLREAIKLSLVEEYAKDVGYYLEKWSTEVNCRLDKERGRYSTDGNRIADPFQSASVTISQLYAMIIDGTLDLFESKIVLRSAEKYKLFYHTPEYHQSINHANVIRHASPSGRKHLSLLKRNVALRTAICIASIFGLIVLDAIITNLINW